MATHHPGVRHTGVVLNQGQFCLPKDIWQHLGTFPVVTAERAGATGMEWGTARGAAKHPAVHTTVSPTKNFLEHPGQESLVSI